MRVGILTQYYPPEMGAAQARLSELAARLRARGHHVTVLTSFPNYPQGKVWEGYRGLMRREQADGVDVIRTWIWPNRSLGIVRRTASYLSFTISALVAGLLRLPKLDVLVTESPPLTLGATGYALSRIKRARLVFNVSDLWPESAIALGVLGEGRAARLAYALEAFCYRKSWAVSGQTATIVSDVRRRFPSVRTIAFPNGVDVELFSPDKRSAQARRRHFGEASFAVVYAGLHGIAQGLDQILDAAERLRGEDVSFFLVGDGPEKPDLVAAAVARGLANVHFADPLPRADVPALIASADAVVVTLVGGIDAVPSKLYEALGSGVPVILVARGEGERLVAAARAGIVTEPGDAEALAAAVRRLLHDPVERRQLGANGRIAAVANFDRAAIFDRYIDELTV